MRFYTRIDGKEGYKTKHPWQMVIGNQALINNGVYRYRHWEHTIIDCGIEHFLSGEHTEYPDGYHEKHIRIAKQVTKDYGMDKIWVTMPDYPDDYNPGVIKNNVGKTLANIKKYHDISGVKWMYPIQAKYRNRVERYQNFRIYRNRINQIISYNDIPKLTTYEGFNHEIR